MKRILCLTPLLAATACASGYGPPPAPAGGASAETYRALGTEPGWTVTIANGRIDYEGDYGQTRFSLPRPEPRTTFNGHRYEARTPDHTLILDVTHTRCNDGMSDRVFADTVLVIADGKELRGCGGTILQPASLADTNWSITAINGETIAPDAVHFLRFDRDRLSGKAGCNSFSAAYTASPDTLDAGPVVATKMACPPPLMAHEQRVFAILARPMRLTFGDETLTLSNDAGTIALRRSI